MTTTQTSSATKGKLPIPPRRNVTRPLKVGDFVPTPKTTPVIAASDKLAASIASSGRNSNVIEPARVALGTVVDGIDCSGMTDDPKKVGIPIYLQTQNKRELNAEQKAKIAELQKKLALEKRAKTNERKEMAKKLGMSPTEMRKTGAPLKSDKKTKAAKPAKAAKPKLAERADGLKAGSKFALLLDTAVAAGENGATLEALAKKLGWRSVSWTLKQVCKKAHAKLRVEDGRAFVTLK